MTNNKKHLWLRVSLCFLLTLCQSAFAADYIGAAQCISCHEQQAKEWQQSDHYHAMEPANSETVLGDFANKTLSFHGLKSRFFTEGEQFFIETINLQGEPQRFPVRYTFGYQPLQQYLLDIGRGKLQAFNIAWDSRPERDGGQRWFHLQPDENISPEHPFFWQGYFQNWNNRCADCHSTNLQKNYQPESDSYNSQWSDVNVACEACHGPGAEHQQLAVSGKLSDGHHGLLSTGTKTGWEFLPGKTIASPTGHSDDGEINTCGGCHSRRMQLKEPIPGEDFHNQYRLQLLNEGLYFADGQIQDEVFVLGSFLQSKMYDAGVRCSDCHNAHTGKLKAEGNALCAQCHLPAEYDSPEHHQHQAASAGSACVDCHMPERRYMGVDDRRDHSFTLPTIKALPTSSHPSGTDTPTACANCHNNSDSGSDWLKKSQAKFGAVKPPHWSQVNQRARAQDMLSVRPMSVLANDTQMNTIKRATLIEQLGNFPSRVSLESLQPALQSNEPMIRRAAVSGIAFLPAQQRWPLLKPLIDDPSKSVRFEVAASLAGIINQLSEVEQKTVSRLLAEYRVTLMLNLDSPSGRIALANFELRMNNAAAAEQHYQAALTLSPSFVPALLSYAEFKRQQGNELSAAPLLKKAIKIAPDGAGAQHAYGLYLVRQQQIAAALPHLAEAATLATAQPRYAYVYAVALENTGKLSEAIDALVAADQRWPNQYDLLLTIIMYAEKAGREQWSLPYLSKLSAIAPSSPAVRERIMKYQQQQQQQQQQ